MLCTRTKRTSSKELLVTIPAAVPEAVYGVSVFGDTAPVTHCKRTFSAASVVLLAITGLLLAFPGVTSAAPSSGWRYTMVAFSNASASDMDVYESSDGLDYQALRLGAYHPPSGLVRDPSIFRAADGTYYLAYTTGGTTIGFARSTDRVNWTHITDYPVPLCCMLLPGTGDGKGWGNLGSSSGSAGPFNDLPSFSPFTTKAWAPDWFVENGQVSVILSMSTGGGFVPYLMTALNSAMSSWSFPTPIAGLGADHIDTTIVKVGSTYHAFTKNETKKVIQHAVSQSLGGPYAFVPIRDWGPLLEAPAVTQLPNGDWRIYLDAYTRGKYFYADSTDGLNTWSPLKELPGLSGTVRHAGVMREAQ